MKSYKTKYSSLKQIFDTQFVAGQLAESLLSFDDFAPTAKVKNVMNKRRYDVVGIRKEGIVKNIAALDTLKGETCGKYSRKILKSQIINYFDPILNVLPKIENDNFVFVISFNEIDGIITMADLEKQPIRIWLFSLISILEMEMLQFIKSQYPYKSWLEFLNPNRKKKAYEIYKNRKSKNMEIELADCLQFCDKRTILLKNSNLINKMSGKKKLEIKFKEIEKLRDTLAHSQEIIKPFWPNLTNIATNIEAIISELEKM